MNRFLHLTCRSILLLLFTGCSSIGNSAVDKTCFPVEQLSITDQKTAESWLTRALDYEGLYTLFDPVKPLSNVVITWFPPPERPDTLASVVSRMETMQRIAKQLKCGPVEAIWTPNATDAEGKRFAHVSLVNRDAFSQVIASHPEYFAQWGFTRETEPLVVISVLEFDTTIDRHRGLGYLYGYPEAAVDFFVDAAASQDSTNVFVPRNFVQIPVYRAETGHFTYAVPLDYTLSQPDSSRAIRARSLLDEYTRLRPRYMNPDSTIRSVKLIRDWKRRIREAAQ